MKRVTGIGGVFFQAKDPEALQAWYRKHLGIDVQVWGGATFPGTGTMAWSVEPRGSDHFAPGTAAFMVNYRVENLVWLVQQLRDEGCNLVGSVDESEYGKFAWVVDPEGNKIELWEPPAGQ